MSRKETEKQKLANEWCQKRLMKLLQLDENKECQDCMAKSPRWVSWNIGVFLCIRCAGIHRNLGVHISRVKSVNLDTWTPEQIACLEQMGNSLGRAVYEANVPDNFRRPQTDSALESFIRAKYETKKYIAKEWVPQPPPKLDWEKEIEEEEKLKKKKKAAVTTGIPISIPPPTSSEKKVANSSNNKTVTIPPLAKVGNLSSPKANRTERKSASNGSSDLLGLNTSVSSSIETKNDSFASFLSSSTSSANAVNTSTDNNTVQTKSDSFSSLDKEEADFFNQTTIDTSSTSTSKANMTKENILALYSANPVNNFPVFNGTHTATFAPQNPTIPIPGVYAQPNAYAQQFPVNNQFMGNANPLMVQQPHPQQQPQPFMPQMNMPGTVNNQWAIPNTMAPQQKFMPQMSALPATAAVPTDPISKQFGNLNLNNVWQ